jgi:hypothetical protein
VTRRLPNSDKQEIGILNKTSKTNTDFEKLVLYFKMSLSKENRENHKENFSCRPKWTEDHADQKAIHNLQNDAETRLNCAASLF